MKDITYTDGRREYKVMPIMPEGAYIIKHCVMCRNVEGFELWWKPTEKADKIHDTKEAAQKYLDAVARKKGWSRTG